MAVAAGGWPKDNENFTLKALEKHCQELLIVAADRLYVLEKQRDLTEQAVKEFEAADLQRKRLKELLAYPSPSRSKN